MNFKAIQGVHSKNMIFGFSSKKANDKMRVQDRSGDHVVNGQKTILSLKNLPSIHRR
jgi:hypothetical protein